MTRVVTYPVPKGTREAACRGCSAPIYWVLTLTNKKMPVDCEADGCFPPTAREEGLGVSHFTTCTKANDFSGRNRA
jgi:hypothetical protein